MKILLTLLVSSLFLPVYLFSNEILNTDIIPRTINFLIFFGFLYYLLQPKISTFLNGRISQIVKSLEDAQIARDEAR
jgi:F-type H+-transporting ATPase subunit b